MYKLCKTEQSAARQRELEQGLLEEMQDRRYEDISIQDLCEKMKIPRKSFYRYFSGKEGALQALIDHTLLEFEWMEFYGDRIYREELERFLLFWVRRKNFLGAIVRSGLSSVLVERTVQQALESVGVTQEISLSDGEVRRYTVIYTVSGLMAAVLNWHARGCPVGAKKLAQVLETMMPPQLRL